MNIFVAKLNPSTTRDSLRALFEQYGQVAFSKVVMDRETGRSKCYGFIEMANDDEGRSAVDSLNQAEFEGNRIVVKEAEPRDRQFTPRPGGGGGGGGFAPRGDRPSGDFGNRSGGGGGNSFSAPRRDRNDRGGNDRNDRFSDGPRRGGRDEYRRGFDMDED